MFKRGFWKDKWESGKLLPNLANIILTSPQSLVSVTLLRRPYSALLAFRQLEWSSFQMNLHFVKTTWKTRIYWRFIFFLGNEQAQEKGNVGIVSKAEYEPNVCVEDVCTERGIIVKYLNVLVLISNPWISESRPVRAPRFAQMNLQPLLATLRYRTSGSARNTALKSASIWCEPAVDVFHLRTWVPEISPGGKSYSLVCFTERWFLTPREDA